MLAYLEAYLKHSALNFGQAAQGLRFLFTHPDVDAVAPPGTVRHVMGSVRIRSRRLANDMFFAMIPPHWHHTPEECRSFRPYPAARWFDAGYRPCRFTETGEFLPPDAVTREARWDPRCKD